ncbi:hypothetical protein [Halarcobacter sp.]|uniref:hypothetical protein n=1 Tax=Halarcobacter sp. TaxID=2321133 RepID=UPI002AAAE8B3|nr:hypothetical protein [Halarcobacter sp.]
MRPEFQEVQHLLNRLLSFAQVFDINNREDWSHLKHRELGYVEPTSILDKLLHLIYATGRDLAVYMSFKLQEFNDTRTYPTLKSYVDSFENGWLYQINLLEKDSQKAKQICKEQLKDNAPWAINQMIKLFDNQIDLLHEIKKIINALKNSNVYILENNDFQNNFLNISYENILQSIISIGKEFERKPITYSSQDEESLRDFILVALQSSHHGRATAETINKRGKTDILIRNNNENIFIAECKFWHGESTYLQAINQLLSYLTWRDRYASLIIFVQNKNFTNVINNIIEYTKAHANFIRCTFSDEIRKDFEFYSNEDINRNINISVLLFHIPKIS